MRFGIIGTNSISHTFMCAALKHPGFHLGAVYSRRFETGEAFARQYGVDCVYTSLEALAASKFIDAVYIASPNCCHASQAVMMMEHGKHVLCEKPIASDLKELEWMIEVGHRNHVLLMEAMRSAYDPGFLKIKELLPKLGIIRRVNFSYCQYSSRYDAYKQGNILNAFNPGLSNAAVMDIGVYCIHPMVRLFGMPDKILANSLFLPNHMEGTGTVIADYQDMMAVLEYSKISNSYLPSQIQGENGSMIISEIPNPKRLEIRFRNGEKEIYEIQKESNNLYYEIGEFMKQIAKGDDGQENLQYSIMEMSVMDQIRELAGIQFFNGRDTGVHE